MATNQRGKSSILGSKDEKTFFCRGSYHRADIANHARTDCYRWPRSSPASDARAGGALALQADARYHFLSLGI